MWLAHNVINVNLKQQLYRVCEEILIPGIPPWRRLSAEIPSDVRILFISFYAILFDIIKFIQKQTILSFPLQHGRRLFSQVEVNTLFTLCSELLYQGSVHQLEVIQQLMSTRRGQNFVWKFSLHLGKTIDRLRTEMRRRAKVRSLIYF